ncbi:MAG: SH3 domain-containing protein, partial [Eubacterium sp.]|nr:SH3 domain-containing protein [Eubacterium sp.]
MFKKTALAGITMIAMMSLCAPVMAAENAPANMPVKPILYAEAVNPNEASVTALDKTMYVTADMLYVRAIPSTEGEVIGAFYYGADVKVTGQIDQTSEGQRWFRIALDNKEGFVSAEFLTDAAPASYTAAPAAGAAPAVYTAPATVPAGNTGTSPSGAPIVKTSYVYAQSGALVQIQKDANGNWSYGDGSSLTWITDNEAMTEGGEAFT